MSNRSFSIVFFFFLLPKIDLRKKESRFEFCCCCCYCCKRIWGSYFNRNPIFLSYIFFHKIRFRKTHSNFAINLNGGNFCEFRLMIQQSFFFKKFWLTLLSFSSPDSIPSPENLEYICLLVKNRASKRLAPQTLQTGLYT